MLLHELRRDEAKDRVLDIGGIDIDALDAELFGKKIGELFLGGKAQANQLLRGAGAFLFLFLSLGELLFSDQSAPDK